jgi:hypothetical protein
MTTEELDALPVGSRVVDRDGDVFVKVTAWMYTDPAGRAVGRYRSSDYVSDYRATLAAADQRSPDRALN